MYRTACTHIQLSIFKQNQHDHHLLTYVVQHKMQHHANWYDNLSLSNQLITYVNSQ